MCVTCENAIYIYTFFIFFIQQVNQFPLNISVCKSTEGAESSGDSAAAELASDLAACLGAGGGATGPRCHHRKRMEHP